MEAAEEPAEALLHLVGRLIGEGDGEDVEGREAALLDQVSGAVGEDAGLAAAGAGEYEKGAVAVEDGLLLAVVEPRERWRVGVFGHMHHYQGSGTAKRPPAVILSQSGGAVTLG